jgi:hypothetical protein
MKENILSNLNDPAQLEKLYRTDKSAFKRAFNALYPELKNDTLTGFWNARLNFPKDDITWGSRTDLLFVIIASLIGGLIAKLPVILGIDEELFYMRNLGFIVFPALTFYFAWKNKLPAGKIAFIAGATLFGLIFINALPDDKKSDTLVLSCIHLALFLWAIFGFSFVGEWRNDQVKRLAYLRFNGDMIVMTTLIVIAGFIMSAVTMGLFSLIGINIEKFYGNYIVVFLLPAAPFLGTYLVRTNPQLIGKVSPVIAKIFSPLVLVMLVVYLIAIIYSGKNPYNDREFLLMFNGLLIGVMAIIFFSVAESSKSIAGKTETFVLLLLSVVTVIVNCIALSAIVFRISEWGFTPNRTAVLGGNVLILVNLLMVTAQLFKTQTKRGDLTGVGKAMAGYLPVYCLWALIVTFLFPLIFGFK